MALTLTPGSESRLDGAPELPLPVYADFVDSVARRLVAMDKEGALYGGDPNNAKADAEKWANDYIEGQRQKTAANRAAAEAGAQKTADARNGRRAATRGVVPESLPADEYGAVPGRTVREANRPQADAERALEQEQMLADEITGGLRTGQQNWQAKGDRHYAQEYGLGGFEHGPGQTDLDIRRRLQEQRGFIRTQKGMVPVGPPVTPEEIESVRKFDQWANQIPGSDTQARYAPQDYEKFREGVRNDIRANAQQDMATYGTGSDDQLKDAIERGNRTAGEQYKKRQERKASEERVRNAQRGRFYEERLRADAGLAPQSLGPNPTIDDLERAAFTQRYTKRQRELEARKQNRIDQAMLAGGQPTGGPFGTRAMTSAINQLPGEWRHVAILDRITGGRGGPTPIARDAMSLQNMQRLLNNDALAGNDPFRQQMQRDAQMLRDAQLPPADKMAVSRARGEPMGTGLSAGPVQSAWNSAWSEQGFIDQMEASGYQLPEIQSWIDRQRNQGGGGPGGNTLPSTVAPSPGTTGLPEAGPAPPGWPIGRPWPPE